MKTTVKVIIIALISLLVSFSLANDNLDPNDMNISGDSSELSTQAAVKACWGKIHKISFAHRNNDDILTVKFVDKPYWYVVSDLADELAANPVLGSMRTSLKYEMLADAKQQGKTILLRFKNLSTCNKNNYSNPAYQIQINN